MAKISIKCVGYKSIVAKKTGKEFCLGQFVGTDEIGNGKGLAVYETFTPKIPVIGKTYHALLVNFVPYLDESEF